MSERLSQRTLLNSLNSSRNNSNTTINLDYDEDNKTANEMEAEVLACQLRYDELKKGAELKIKRKRDEETEIAKEAVVVSGLNRRLKLVRTEYAVLHKKRLDTQIFNEANPLPLYPTREILRNQYPDYNNIEIDDEYYYLKEKYYDEVDLRKNTLNNLRSELNERLQEVEMTSKHLAEFVPKEIIIKNPNQLDLEPLGKLLLSIQKVPSKLSTVPTNVPLLDPTGSLKSDSKRNVANDVVTFIDLYDTAVESNGGSIHDWIRWLPSCLLPTTQLEIPSNLKGFTKAGEHLTNEECEVRKREFINWLRIEHDGPNYKIHNMKHLQSLKMNQANFEYETGKAFSNRYKKAIKNCGLDPKRITSEIDIGLFIDSVDMETRRHCLNNKGLKSFCNLSAAFDEVKMFSINTYGHPCDVIPVEYRSSYETQKNVITILIMIINIAVENHTVNRYSS